VGNGEFKAGGTPVMDLHFFRNSPNLNRRKLMKIRGRWLNAVSCLGVCENRRVDHFRAMRFFLRVAFAFLFFFFFRQKSLLKFRLLTSLFSAKYCCEFLSIPKIFYQC